MAAFYPFVIRSSRRHDYLVVIPQFTWQAYNSYGGSSLYSRDALGVLAHRVSFERPYNANSGATYLLSDWVSHELQVIRWLEQRGYDVGYISDLDLALAADRELPQTKALLFAGHDEYWTWAEYDRVVSLRDAGIHLVFFAANNAYWNTRLEAGGHTVQPGARLVCFKGGNDPEAHTSSEVTTRFRDPPLNRPENGLYGIMYSELIPNGWWPLVPVDSVVGPEAHDFLLAANISADSLLPNLVGNEGDRPFPSESAPKNLQVLFKSPNRIAPGPTNYYYTTFFIAPSGAGVFAAGNNEWARGLDGSATNAHLQQLMAAVLDWMLKH